MTDEIRNEDGHEFEATSEVRHGLDNNPTGDAEKGAALGGVGGLIAGAAAGAIAGPGGAVVGAVIGGIAGAVGSGLAVAAVDRIDDDDTVTGIGDLDNPLKSTGSEYNTTVTNVGATEIAANDVVVTEPQITQDAAMVDTPQPTTMGMGINEAVNSTAGMADANTGITDVSTGGWDEEELNANTSDINPAGTLAPEPSIGNGTETIAGNAYGDRTGSSGSYAYVEGEETPPAHPANNESDQTT